MSSTSGSATSSDRSSRSNRSSRTFLCAAAILLLTAPLANAKVFLSQKEALAAAFPDADRVEEKTFILRSVQSSEIEKRARAPLHSEIVTLHIGFRQEEVLGYAVIDVHTVRTKPEAFMVVLSPEGRVRSLRVLAFWEPLDYLPVERWYAQFEGKSLDSGLRVGRDLHGIVGSTLSARAVAESVRRALAYYAVLVAPTTPAAD